MDNSKPVVVALEEHWADPAISGSAEQGTNPLLIDVGDRRLEAMDAAGIDMQVVSHTVWRRSLNAETEIELAVAANNRLQDFVSVHPERLGGFATLPMLDAVAGADELERAVTQLGFKGAMVFPLNDGEFLDEKRFWPVFERAAAMDVPIYIHPGVPHPGVVDAYYSKYMDEFPLFAEAAWGFAVETGTCAMRLIFSRIFDAYPNLKIIMGHLGEFIPFALDRIDERLWRRRGTRFPFREYFCDHFYATTSGFFSTPALLCTVMAMGIDHVLFSVDYPMNENADGMDWMATLPLSAEDKAKIYGGNAQRLLKL